MEMLMLELDVEIELKISCLFSINLVMIFVVSKGDLKQMESSTWTLSKPFM